MEWHCRDYYCYLCCDHLLTCVVVSCGH
jgi:hypothetical protein